MTLTLRITLAYVFHLKLKSKKKICFKNYVIACTMSSTYKHIMTYSPFLDLVYSYLSTSLVENMSQSKIFSSFSCHCFGVCFNPKRF